ncbi:unnamed protein product [Closterium sp. NIES-64]|nr:unnamed protein product [Closterium sp. NIES-64]
MARLPVVRPATQTLRSGLTMRCPSLTQTTISRMYLHPCPCFQDTDDEDVESDEEENASSDEEGDAAAELDDDDSAPECTFHPCENFNTLMEVFRFIVGCNNGAGLSNESTVWLLNLLRDERLDLELTRHWRTLYAVIRFGMSLLMSQRQYDTITFTIPGWEGEFQVIRANGREALIEILGNPENAEGFVLRPRQVNSAAGRVYTTPETASFWEHAQVAAELEYGAGAVVVPLIISSDATILRVWAVYLSIANIPLRRRWMDCGKLLLAMLPFPPATMTPAQKVELFQAAMKIVLAYLIVASHVRMEKMYPDARLAGLRSPGSGSYWASGANFTASEHASAMKLAPFAIEGEVDVVSRLALVTVLQWHETHVRAPCHSDTSLGDFEEATKRMIQTVEDVFPREGDGWNLIKVHLLTHVPDGVRRGGLPPEFSAAVYENAHIRTCKLPYRTSNHRQSLQAIAARNVHALAMGQLTSALPARRRNQTALTRAIATGTPQLTLARRSLTARPDHESSAASVFDDVNIAVGGLLFHYDTVMRNAGLRPFPAWVRAPYHTRNARMGCALFTQSTNPSSTTPVHVCSKPDPQLLTTVPPAATPPPPHPLCPPASCCSCLLMCTQTQQAHTAVALPAFPTDYGHIRPHYARAAASLHGHTAFSCVEYLSSAGRTTYGRLILLLDAERPLDDCSYEHAEVAVLQRLNQQGLDECTGCQVLAPPSLFRGLAVVPIDRLQRAVHCVPSFEQKDTWFLNKWAYLVNQEIT